MICSLDQVLQIVRCISITNREVYDGGRARVEVVLSPSFVQVVVDPTLWVYCNLFRQATGV